MENVEIELKSQSRIVKSVSFISENVIAISFDDDIIMHVTAEAPLTATQSSPASASIALDAALKSTPFG